VQIDQILAKNETCKKVTLKLTRKGINKICKNHLSNALPEERVKMLMPVYSFRHSCAVDMVCSGKSIDEIKYRLGHRCIDSTMVYLHLDLNRPRELLLTLRICDLEYPEVVKPAIPQPSDPAIPPKEKKEGLSGIPNMILINNFADMNKFSRKSTRARMGPY